MKLLPLAMALALIAGLSIVTVAPLRAAGSNTGLIVGNVDAATGLPLAGVTVTAALPSGQ